MPNPYSAIVAQLMGVGQRGHGKIDSQQGKAQGPACLEVPKAKLER